MPWIQFNGYFCGTMAHQFFQRLPRCCMVWTTLVTVIVWARASTWERSKFICSLIQRAGVLPMHFDSLMAISGDMPAVSLMRLDKAGRDTFNALAASVTLKSSSL